MYKPVENIKILVKCMFSLGVMRMGRIGAVHVRCFGDNVREVRLSWFGHVH